MNNVSPVDGRQSFERRLGGQMIAEALAVLGFASRPIDLRPLPFAGTWGVASSICHAVASDVVRDELEQTGALEGLSKKDAKRRIAALATVWAQEIAERVAATLNDRGGVARVDAVNGYVNISFGPEAAARLVGEVLERGSAYGGGEPRLERVMVEHSQPNTHKAFHVGHLRNVCLGVAVSNILAAAGYEVLQATYPGDIGMHVIKCLWCYERFHQGEEPADPTARGRWLGDLYAESDARLNLRKETLAWLQGIADGCSTGVHEFVGLALDRALADEEHIPMLWSFLGDRLRALRDEGDRHNGNGRWATEFRRWEALSARVADWWTCVPVWREEVTTTFQRWERREPAFVRLWEETREWSLVDFRRIFAELGARFDVWFFESEVEAEGKVIVRELLERGIAEISQLPDDPHARGMPVVKIDEKLGLDKPTYRTLPILRSDGTSLYSTKDLALTKRKFEQYGIDRTVWVVDVRQSLYFEQIAKTMELWGFAQAREAFHLGYEMVVLPEGVISSRKGNVPLYDDIRDAVLARAREVIEEKNPALANGTKERVAWQVAIGALTYTMLARDNTKIITFDLEEALSFDGNTAPYIQYAHARACSILRRAGISVDDLILRIDRLDFGTLTPQELGLLQQIAALPADVERAAAEYRPLLLANYVYELAKRFNDFYHACPVLPSGEPVRTARLALVAASRQTLANALALLGIAAPEEM